MDLILDQQDWIYRFEEIEMLANKICSIFKQSSKYHSTEVSLVKERHDKIKNAQKLIEIYKKIVK